MRRRRSPWTLLLVVLALSACATKLDRPVQDDAAVARERFEQQKLAIEIALERQIRVWRLGYRLNRAGADMCGSDVRHAFGVFVVARDLFRDDTSTALEALGIGEDAVVWETIADGPAATALVKGDRITRAGDRDVVGFKSFVSALDDAFESGELSMRVVDASGVSRDVTLVGERICEYPVAVVESDSVNAMADGSRVLITNGMLRFAGSDDHLALVVGHEISHNALGHVTQLRLQTTAGALADFAIAIFTGINTGLFTRLARRAYSQSMEADADYMGLYLAARAGQEIGDASVFWRRMAIEHPGNIQGNMLATHPSSPERAAMIEQAVREIRGKRVDGEPLFPNGAAPSADAAEDD